MLKLWKIVTKIDRKIIYFSYVKKVLAKE